jgi:hypothetical protein
MSDITISNPENLSVDPRIRYVIRCAKQEMTASGRDPKDVTGILRGEHFYKHVATEVSIARSPDTHLLWGNHRSVFINSEHIYGIQLYDTVTGGHLGTVSIFDIAATHYLLHPECVSDCVHEDKYTSVVVAVTCRHFSLFKKSPLELNGGRSGNFSTYTRMVGVKNIPGDHQSMPKGVGKRIYSLIADVLQRGSSNDPKVRQLAEVREALKWASRQLAEGYSSALEAFSTSIDVTKYSHTSGYTSYASGLLPELILNPGTLAKFMGEESEAIDTLRKSYDAASNLADFKKQLTRVVCHDLTTGVVAVFTAKLPPTGSELSSFTGEVYRQYFANMDSLTDSEGDNPYLGAKIAVLNIGLQNTELLHNVNYVSNVGLAYRDEPMAHSALQKGSHKGGVYYFIDDRQQND